MNLKKLEKYLPVNLLGPGPRLIKTEFTGPRSHRGSETLLYSTTNTTFTNGVTVIVVKILNSIYIYMPNMIDSA